MGLLLLSGSLVGLEYAARHRPELLPEELQEQDPLFGWAPSATTFLMPAGKSAASAHSLLDAQGFRLQPGQPLQAESLQFVCLGNERTFAPHLPADQTFTGQWNSEQTSPQSASLVANGGMPQGCPLLWMLLLKQRADLLSKHWICFIDESTPAADVTVRRGTRFSPSEQPLASKHPAARTENDDERTNKLPFMELSLIQRAVPLICGLLLGDFTDDRVVSSSTDTDLDRDDVFQALEPLVELQEHLESRGGSLTVVYLPLTDETSGRQSENNFPQMLSQFTTAHQLKFFDLSGALRPTDASVRFTDNQGRLTIEAHRQIAVQLRRHFQPALAGGLKPVEQAIELTPLR